MRTREFTAVVFEVTLYAETSDEEAADIETRSRLVKALKSEFPGGEVSGRAIDNFEIGMDRKSHGFEITEDEEGNKV